MSNFTRKVRRAEERRAIVLARAQGCRCSPDVSWHPIVVDGRSVRMIRLGHALDCPRLAELRGLVGAEPLPFDVVTARLSPGGRR